VAWQSACRAQTTYVADFDATFPAFGYTYDYAGYGNPPDYTAIDASDQVSSVYDVVSPPAATAAIDTSTWAPAVMEGGYTYAGWGLGIGFVLPEGMRPTSGDLSAYKVTFDASVAGYLPSVDGLNTELKVIFQIPDADGDGDVEEYVVGASGSNLGMLPALPRLNSTAQTFSINLGDLYPFGGPIFNFADDYAQTIVMMLELAPNTNVDQIGLDNDNVVSVDNVRFEGPFAGTLTADYDGNLVVDGNDFLVWQRGESPIFLSAEDLAQWRTQYGLSASAVVAAGAIPEPTASTLAAMCLGSLAVRIARRPSSQ
jgi:hypothetical protein